MSRNEAVDANYYGLLTRIHSFLRPKTYVEIGVRDAASLLLAKKAKAVIGIDPAPHLPGPLPAGTRVFSATSDDFFAQHDLVKELGGRRVDLAFIDGMHLFEFALRDFMNLEKNANPSATILVHDCYPTDPVTASRERTTAFWSGDVWKLVVCLKKYRPDLKIWTIDVPPTGLAVIRNLNPASTVLPTQLEAICKEFVPRDFAELETDKPQKLNRLENRWNEIKPILSSGSFWRR